MSKSLALPFQTAKQLAAAIRKKKIGCLELLDLYLKRVEAFNPELNAIIASDIEGARKRAKAADKAVKAGKKLGPLHGVPNPSTSRACPRPGAILRSRTTRPRRIRCSPSAWSMRASPCSARPTFR
jgi:hypothetical protein